MCSNNNSKYTSIIIIIVVVFFCIFLYESFDEFQAATRCVLIVVV